MLAKAGFRWIKVDMMTIHKISIGRDWSSSENILKRTNVSVNGEKLKHCSIQLQELQNLAKICCVVQNGWNRNWLQLLAVRIPEELEESLFNGDSIISKMDEETKGSNLKQYNVQMSKTTIMNMVSYAACTIHVLYYSHKIFLFHLTQVMGWLLFHWLYFITCIALFCPHVYVAIFTHFKNFP